MKSYIQIDDMFYNRFRDKQIIGVVLTFDKSEEVHHKLLFQGLELPLKREIELLYETI